MDFSIEKLEKFRELDECIMGITHKNYRSHLSVIKKIIHKEPDLVGHLEKHALTMLLRNVLADGAYFKLRAKVIDLIIKYDAEVSPLQLALVRGDYKLADFLLWSGTMYDDLEGIDYSPAEYVLWRREKHMLQLLLSHGMDTSFRNRRGQNLLHLFGAHVLTDHDNVAEIAKVLIDAGVPVNDLDKSNWTPLMYAVTSENLELIKCLIDNGADVNGSGRGRVVPMHLAADVENLKVIDLLVSRGADINAKDLQGWTPLHVACKDSSKETIGFLIRKGADVCNESRKGVTPYSQIKISNRKDDYHECLVTVIKEFARRNFESIAVLEKDMDLVWADPMATEHFQGCLAELRIMWRTKFFGPHTYFSVLDESIDVQKLAHLTKNEKIVTKFEVGLWEFPYHEEDLRRVFGEILKVKDALEAVSDRLGPMFKHVLPETAIRKLTDYLTLKDLPLQKE